MVKVAISFLPPNSPIVYKQLIQVEHFKLTCRCTMMLACLASSLLFSSLTKQKKLFSSFLMNLTELQTIFHKVFVIAFVD